MRVKVLDSAHQDLLDGYWFYERQGVGLGDYFVDTLYGEIDSLALYAGIHSDSDLCDEANSHLDAISQALHS